MNEVVILSAVRTPIGKMGRSLSSLSSVDLGTLAAKKAIEQAHIAPEIISQAIVGNVLQAGAGQNVARQIALKSGLSETSTAMTINQVCGSGLKAIRLGQSAIMLGDAEAVLVGGTESMTNVPHLVPNMRQGKPYGSTTMLDGLEHDGLLDAFSHKPMGITAENVAHKYHVTREAQDALALRSHQRAVKATESGAFNDEIVPVTITLKKGTTTITRDEPIRPDTSMAALAGLKPAFVPNGMVTAGNAAGLNDGASMLVLMSKARAEQANIPYLAVLDTYQEAGIDPNYMGYAPFYAVNQLLAKQQMSIDDIDRFEINEAFAAQTVAVMRDLQIPDDKVNVNGGAIALGHPVGASGARIVTTLVHDLKRENLKTGIATLCVGGGMGVALSLHLE
ncbi:acetyl-CoA C-acetyltransferase [Secundilactobacillus paracollinoides]|uniref:acetyl-CoA C-acetyltransferase n=1 Tax=Secundilactobacillus paracollinoides TaxID=240427 RepID=A0A1B2IX75_9LACO|nr:acetyl-CoA C-acetyltransferase [Secundilactobacillus paracollinoides]ANZ60786.1 3-ketoacyl-CoA thiolase [Secundilactobacillus paracollinoides]ANZ66630.1 3-ketoacyl-CoA thiolase [Secundilactobacillus paracollinoides]KRL79193.1 acetyl-CoA acetyltransferase [Secundilactobacillus paracollinoides DSM 15502 = JCM 11969]